LWSSSALLQSPQSMTVPTNQSAKVFCEAKSVPKTTLINWLRQRQGPAKERPFEFLASWNPSKRTSTYGEGVKKENVVMFSDITRYTLSLTSVKPEDSGTYFCMVIGSPQLIFGTGTELNVVDALPTTAPTTKKTIIIKKKKQCPSPNPKAQKGLTCGLITLSLLVASTLVLLVSLSVAIHFHCLRRKARIRFMKQEEILYVSSRLQKALAPLALKRGYGRKPTFLTYLSSTRTARNDEVHSILFSGKKDGDGYTLTLNKFNEEYEGYYFCSVTSNSVVYFSPLVPVFLPEKPTTPVPRLPTPVPTIGISRPQRPEACRPGAGVSG
ncbi:hypothetical protein STEG23_000428, partial [Scotinomys teguina]